MEIQEINKKYYVNIGGILFILFAFVTAILCCMKKTNKSKNHPRKVSSTLEQKEQDILRAEENTDTQSIQSSIIFEIPTDLGITVSTSNKPQIHGTLETKPEHIIPLKSIPKNLDMLHQDTTDIIENIDQPPNDFNRRRTFSDVNTRQIEQLSPFHLVRSEHHRQYRSFNIGHSNDISMGNGNEKYLRHMSLPISGIAVPASNNCGDIFPRDKNNLFFQSPIGNTNENIRKSLLDQSNSEQLHLSPKIFSDQELPGVSHRRRFSSGSENQIFIIKNKKYKEPYSRDVRYELNHLMHKIHHDLQTKQKKESNMKENSVDVNIGDMGPRKKHEIYKAPILIPDPDYN